MTGNEISIDQRYRLVNIKGRTLFATQVATGISVILKPIDHFQDPRVIRHLSRIRHPSIPRVLDEIMVSIGSCEQAYLAMEYLEGETFSEWLSRAGGRLVSEQLLPLMAQAARTLAFLHEQNEPVLMHLDIKPEHLVKMPDNSIGLIDYDCARLGPVEAAETATVRCTIGYAAPELMAGQPSARSDIYALGVAMLALLTGCRVDSAVIPPLEPLCRHLPQAVVRILETCLSVDPSSRYPTASALACALEQQCLVRHSTETATTRPEQGPAPVGPTPAALPEPADGGKRRNPYQLVTVWDHAEFAVTLATRLAGSGYRTLLIDADLLNPRIDLILGLPEWPGTAASSRNKQVGPTEQAKPGLESALTAMMQKSLESGRFCDLFQKTSVPDLFALAGPFPLLHYDYHDGNALMSVFQTARMHADVIVVCCSRFIHDTFACLSLLSADLGLIPVHAESGPIREFNRYLEFLAGHFSFDRKKFRFIAMDHNPSHHMSLGLMDELCGGLLAGSLPPKDKPGPLERSKKWRPALTRRSGDACDQIIHRLGFRFERSRKVS